MNREQQEKKNYLIGETLTPKSRLIDVYRRLIEEKGCKVAAMELGAIIGRLEHWQNKHTGGK